MTRRIPNRTAHLHSLAGQVSVPFVDLFGHKGHSYGFSLRGPVQSLRFVDETEEGGWGNLVNLCKTLIHSESQPEDILEALKKHCRGRASVPLRRLLRMVEDYPLPALLEAIQSAAQCRLYDLEGVETMILCKLAREYFQIIPHSRDSEDDDE